MRLLCLPDMTVELVGIDELFKNRNHFMTASLKVLTHLCICNQSAPEKYWGQLVKEVVSECASGAELLLAAWRRRRSCFSLFKLLFHDPSRKPSTNVFSPLSIPDSAVLQFFSLTGDSLGDWVRLGEDRGDRVEKAQEFAKLSREDADQLVIDHQGWAESIARSVARAWNMDWRLDGLDGAAMEALLFCARRFQPDRGVPFKGYARKRIHEASTEAARKSRGWKRGLGTNSKSDQASREVSAELFHIFPELREGQLPSGDEGNPGDMRSAVRQLLVGASIIAAKQGLSEMLPDEILDYKRMVVVIASLEAVHQLILWRTYWEGVSMRTVASDWETDELNVIREHKEILSFLQKSMSTQKETKPPKIRPGLREIAMKIKKDKTPAPFAQFLGG